MTRIGPVLLILSFALAAPQAPAAKRLKPGNCQGDLFSRQEETGVIPAGKTEKYSDLTMMQKKLWLLFAEGKSDQAEALKTKLQNQLMLTKRNQPAGTAGRHKLYKATDISYALFREKHWGYPELAAYELNENLGRPLQIPVTVSQLPGSLQLWFGYFTEVKETARETEKSARAIARDADLFFFSFLTANADQHPGNIILDRDAGTVVFDFGNAFALSLQRFLYFAAENFDIPRFAEANYVAIEHILESKKKRMKFDWKSALNRMDTEKIVGDAAFRLGKPQARALEGRLCILKTFFNGGDISSCEAQGFSLQTL